MRPAALNLELYRGDSYNWQFVLWSDTLKTVPVDLTGVTAKSEIRAASGSTPVMTLVCTVELPNIVHVKLPATAWTGIATRKGGWDLQLTYPGGDVVTVLAGTVTVTNDITESTGA